MNDKGVQGLLSSKFELTGEASATAGPVGRHASAGTDWKMNTEALSYSRTKGLFVGVAVDGAVIYATRLFTSTLVWQKDRARIAAGGSLCFFSAGPAAPGRSSQTVGDDGCARRPA